MPRAPEPLPPMRCGLDGVLRRPTVFSTRAAREAGVPAGRLRRSDLESAGRGLWRVRGADVDPRDRLRALQDLHPYGAFSHATALDVLGVPRPDAWAADARVHLSLVAGEPGGARRPGVLLHERMAGTPALVLHGVRVTSADWTFVDFAAERPPFEELVALGDALCRVPRTERERREPSPGVVGLEALEATVRRRAGHRGVVLAREALRAVRPGADSRQETRLRLRIVAAGLPEPRVNPAVPLATGQRLRVDLVWERERVAVEYDGDHHRTDRRQWREDRERDASLRAEGWTVIRVTADVFRDGHWELFLWQLRTALGL